MATNNRRNRRANSGGAVVDNRIFAIMRMRDGYYVGSPIAMHYRRRFISGAVRTELVSR